MLQIEYPYKGNTNKIRHYSNLNVMILQNETGRNLKEAVDTYPTEYTYAETDIPIPPLPSYENTNIPVEGEIEGDSPGNPSI